MAAETRQLNVRIPGKLYDALEAVVADRKESTDTKHGYSKNDAVQDALRAWLASDGEGQPGTDLVAAVDRLERVCDDFEHMRNRIREQDSG